MENYKKIKINGRLYYDIEGNYYSEEECYWRRGGTTGCLPDRITPTFVNTLKKNEIFVFGSNCKGNHISGAAKTAVKFFGAINGVGEGLQGMSYAIPTMEGMSNLSFAIQKFTIFAKQHSELTFYVTAVGCGIAGYSASEVAPHFIDAAYLPNVFLPLSFWEKIIKIVEQKGDV